MGLKANGVTLYGHGGDSFPIAERPTPKAVDTSQHQGATAPLHAGASQPPPPPPPPRPKGGDSSGEAGGGSRHRAGQVRVRVRVKG